jgi:N-acetylglucosamine malate deacetylase 1
MGVNGAARPETRFANTRKVRPGTMACMTADAGVKSPPRYDVLAFGAHPDDIEMTMAGTVARLVKSGRSVLMISLTRGEASTHGSTEDRAAEGSEGARILGASVLLLDFPDTRVENTNDGRLALARLVRAHQPSLVFAPYHTNPGSHHDGRANRDHMATGELVRDALKLARFRRLIPELPPHDVRRILYFMVPANRTPHLVVNVSDEEETIKRSIQAHATQMAIKRRGESIEEILVLYRRMSGVLIGARLGESFLTDEPLEVGPDELMRI